ncbi:unnamed protein product, partial [Mesorhabditis belari]|uniref:Cullin-4 n=1 Tax=Mesorhabditis belari TaxID=2138241 RepID=A0AAF3EL25_9BILA
MDVLEDDDDEDFTDARAYQSLSEDDEPRKPAAKKKENDDGLIVDPSFAAFHFASKNGPPKKLIIKKLKPLDKKNNEDSLKKNWELLSDSIEAIQQRCGVSTSLENLYQTVDTLCKEGKADETYLNLETKLENYLRKQCEEMRANGHTQGLDMLNAVNALWEMYIEQLEALISIFLVLDRFHAINNRQMQSIYDMGLTTFHGVVLDTFGLGQRIGLVLVDQITEERKGEKANTNLLRSSIRMLSALCVYTQLFEETFISASAAFYKEEGEKLVQELDTSAYLHHVDSRIREEETRCDLYLNYTTRVHLFNVLDARLIAKAMEIFVKKGAAELLEQTKYAELKLMYDLLGRVTNGRNILRTEFADFIKKHGRNLVNDPQRDATMVKDLMSFKERMDCCVSNSFAGDEKIGQAEKDAFDYFINTRPTRPAELIAKFMDARLRAGNKENSEEELDSVMYRAMQIFRFIQGKDVFEAFYKRDLAKRLLLSRSASVDAEKAMLLRLRQECGPGFTHKLEGMFKDMDLSIGLNQAFKQMAAHGASLRPDLTVNVLTMGMWPKYDPSEVVIPPEMSQCLQQFSDFYTQKHSGRKLQWQHSLGQALLKAEFPHGTKELQVSLYQATVIVLFNSRNTWKYEDILAATKIEEKDLNRTLQSLACAKHKVLQKSPKGKDVEKSDEFTVNVDFTDKLHRIRISQVQMKETAAEKAHVEEEVSADRIYQIDAALVRTMKTRKTLTHQGLLQELFSQLRFPVKAVDVKTRIASLIERDYMTRDAADSNTYHYVA